MNKIIYIILFLSIGLTCVSGWGQQNSLGECLDQLPTENVSIITDRDFYLSGEMIWFNAYVFLNGELSDNWSKALYVEIFNHKKDIILQQKYRIENGMALGNIEIPGHIESGNYFIRAYTNYSRNFPEFSFTTKLITIINPDSRAEKVVVTSVDIPVKEGVEDVAGSRLPKELKIRIPKLSYGAREKVTIEMESNPDAYFSISVRKKGTAFSDKELDTYRSINPWLYNNTSIEPVSLKGDIINADLEWYPEIRGLSLSGKIKDSKTGENLKGLSCISSIVGEDSQIHLDKTDQDGRFHFVFNELYEEKDIAVSMRNGNNMDAEIFINKDFSPQFPAIKAIPPDSSRHQLFEEMHINQQLGQLFSLSNREVSFSREEFEISLLNLTEPDLSLKLKDFISLPEMIDIFRELVPTVSVTGNRSNRKLEVFEKESFTNHKDPLILLDNVAVQDVDALLSLDPAHLKQIDVYNSVYLLGDHSIEGIISIKTNTNNFAGFKWQDRTVFLNFKTFEPPKSFTYPVYDTNEAMRSTKPDFRTLLYWNPWVNPGQGERSISFYTSDHFSIYEIVIQGYSSNGEYYYGIKEFEVVND